jgi:hypothetical protein
MELENPKLVQHIRRDVARLSTILRERELSEAASPPVTEAAISSETADETTEAASPPETADETPETAE